MSPASSPEVTFAPVGKIGLEVGREVIAIPNHNAHHDLDDQQRRQRHDPRQFGYGVRLHDAQDSVGECRAGLPVLCPQLPG